MHQQIHCHTLPKPFSKIFFFRIYAPTIHSTDIDSAETSAPVYTHLRANPATQTNPPTTPSTKSSRPYSPHKPIHQRHRSTHTTGTTHSADSAPTQPHKRTQTPTRRQAPPTTLTTHREAMPYLDVDAQPASSGLTVRPSGRTRRRSTDAVAAFATGQARYQARSGQTRLDQVRTCTRFNRPGIKQAKCQTRPNRIRPSR